ncbi:hypothetical protein ON021_19980, partial [Microcoleus sp. HI-ES]|nr:hypothetical protein [Microcoleus sp. HI-ES]
GVVSMLPRQYFDSGSVMILIKLDQFRVDRSCEVCHGKRLKPEALSVRLGQYGIVDLTSISIRECRERVNNLGLSDRQFQISDLALREIKARL